MKKPYIAYTFSEAVIYSLSEGFGEVYGIVDKVMEAIPREGALVRIEGGLLRFARSEGNEVGGFVEHVDNMVKAYKMEYCLSIYMDA
jgi:hypothetical protein